MQSKKRRRYTEKDVSKQWSELLKKLTYCLSLILITAGVIISIKGFLLFIGFLLSFQEAIFNALSGANVYSFLSPRDILKSVKPFKNVTEGIYSMIAGGVVLRAGLFLQNLVLSKQSEVNNYDNSQEKTIFSDKKLSNFNFKNPQFAGGLANADTVNANQIGGNITNYAAKQKQNLAEAAAEIQKLLQQLEQTNPTTSTYEKMTVVAKAVDEIEKDPTLKAKIIRALELGGIKELKEAVAHPLVNILMGYIESWHEAEVEPR